MSIPKGTRVILHPATDAWMQGDQYGVIVGLGHARQYTDRFTGQEVTARPYLVKMDRSGRKLRFHPDNVMAVNEPETTDHGAVVTEF